MVKEWFDSIHRYKGYGNPILKTKHRTRIMKIVKRNIIIEHNFRTLKGVPLKESPVIFDNDNDNYMSKDSFNNLTEKCKTNECSTWEHEGLYPSNDTPTLYNRTLVITDKTDEEIINLLNIKESREQGGCSICEDCGTEYTNYEIEKGLVTPCGTCYKCYTEQCTPYSCDCISADEIENYLKTQI
tara:strand:- start:84 stop:638 length:555 start_codon:yes stop_codon:yes gene_type:complete